MRLGSAPPVNPDTAQSALPTAATVQESAAGTAGPAAAPARPAQELGGLVAGSLVSGFGAGFAGQPSRQARICLRDRGFESPTTRCKMLMIGWPPVFSLESLKLVMASRASAFLLPKQKQSSAVFLCARPVPFARKRRYYVVY
jgi:hypothetical protein